MSGLEKSSEHGWPREYWDEDDVHELDTLTVDAPQATERAWYALADVVQAHDGPMRSRRRHGVLVRTEPRAALQRSVC